MIHDIAYYTNTGMYEREKSTVNFNTVYFILISRLPHFIPFSHPIDTIGIHGNIIPRFFVQSHVDGDPFLGTADTIVRETTSKIQLWRDLNR